MGPDMQPSVLVVDDEPSLVRVVEGYLAKDGFVVRTAADGETALALVRESEPDVVVLDLGLPGMDGVEVCRQLRTFSSCYVLMLTARAGTSTVRFPKTRTSCSSGVGVPAGVRGRRSSVLTRATSARAEKGLVT